MWKDGESRGVSWQTSRVEVLRVCHRACLEYQTFDAEQAGGVYEERRRSLGDDPRFASDRHRQMSACQKIATVAFSVEMPRRWLACIKAL